MRRFLAISLLVAPSLCLAEPSEPGAPMPDDIRRYNEQKADLLDSERIGDRAVEWIREGRTLVACQHFNGDVDKITICKTASWLRDDGKTLFWILKDNGQVSDVLEVGDFVYRDSIWKHPQRAKVDPRKIQKRIEELK